MVIKSPGTENLRADPKVKSASPNSGSPGQRSIDVPKGLQRFDDDENKRADFQVFDGKDKPVPTSYRHDVPPGLQSFDDNGQKAGGTRYLGR